MLKGWLSFHGKNFLERIKERYADNNITFQFPGKFMTMRLGEVEIDNLNSDGGIIW